MLDPVTANAPAGPSPVDELADRELVGRVRASLNLRPQEERVLDLWLLGERDERVYAAALGLQDRPAEEQQKETGRVLARLRQRIHRVGIRLRQEDRDE